MACLDMLSSLDKILSMLVTIAIYGTYEENAFCDRWQIWQSISITINNIYIYNYKLNIVFPACARGIFKKTCVTSVICHWLLPRCSLSYAKVVNFGTKSKLFLVFMMPLTIHSYPHLFLVIEYRTANWCFYCRT